MYLSGIATAYHLYYQLGITNRYMINFFFFFRNIFACFTLSCEGKKPKTKTKKQHLLFTGRTQPLGKIHLLSYARPHVSLSKSKYHQPLTSCNLLQVKQIPLQTKKRPVVPVNIWNLYIHGWILSGGVNHHISLWWAQRALLHLLPVQWFRSMKLGNLCVLHLWILHILLCGFLSEKFLLSVLLSVLYHIWHLLCWDICPLCCI